MGNPPQKEVEKSRITEAQLKAIIETAVDGIITINEFGGILSFNPAAERIFGYRADEVIDRNVGILMPSPEREKHDSYVQRYLTTGERTIIGIGREVVGRRKNGDTFPLYLAVAEIKVGKSHLFTGILRDITQAKATEEALRAANQKLETEVWLKRGQAGLYERMRGEQSLPKLCQNILDFVCGYVDALVGAMYLPENQKLKRISCYAYRETSAKESFEFGEGFIGQAAVGKKPLNLTELPPDYIKVISGLGEASPRNLLVVPFVYNGTVEAVVEVGSLECFTAERTGFFAQVSESIGLTIHAARAKMGK